MGNYRTWVRLNFEGKQEWGDVFGDGKVPVASIPTQQASLGRNKDPESVFNVDWKELTLKQQDELLTKLSHKSGAAKEAILKNILKTGLPLSRNLIFSCGTNQVELFL